MSRSATTSTRAGGTSPSDLLTVPGFGRGPRSRLGWSEPESGIQTDLDLYLLDAGTGAIVANTVVNNIQSGSASEMLDYVNPSAGTKTFKLVIGRFTGGTPRIKVIFNRPSAFTSVQWNTSTLGDIVGPTTYGHNAPLTGASVAATPFDNSDRIEEFSSPRPCALLLGAGARLVACRGNEPVSGEANRLFRYRWCVELVLRRAGRAVPLLRHVRLGAARRGSRCVTTTGPAVPDTSPDPRRSVPRGARSATSIRTWQAPA